MPELIPDYENVEDVNFLGSFWTKKVIGWSKIWV